MHCIRLYSAPHSQYHFGRVAVDSETPLSDTSIHPHSDTLFSALVCIADKVAPDQTDALVRAFEQHQIRLSSGFYFLEIEGQPPLYFLPRPVHLMPTFTKDTDLQNNKRLKRIAFLSKGVWEAGSTPEAWLDTARYVILQGSLVCLASELPAEHRHLRLYHTITLPKVAVHKPTKEDSIYYQTNLQIAATDGVHVGFHFLYERAEDLPEALQNLFALAVQLLPDEGLGGERSAGCGRFRRVVVDAWASAAATERDLPIALSLTVPKAEEFDSVRAYRLITRGGRNIGTEYLRENTLRRIKMLTEGSVLTRPIKGRIVPLQQAGQPPHLRCGTCLSLPHPSKSPMV